MRRKPTARQKGRQPMTAQQPFLQQLHKLLLRYHRKLGLDQQQYVLLHSCIHFDEMDIIMEVTGLQEDDIMKTLMDLANRKIISFTANKSIDLNYLYHLLRMIAQDDMPFRDVLVQEYVQENKQNGDHIGHVELVPMNNGIAVRLRNGTFLSISRLRELAEEFGLFAESIREEEIWRVNLQLLSQSHDDDDIEKIVRSG
jgi:hypothetical protein